MPRVLTIDDDPVIRIIVSRVLGSKGIETDDAVHGEDGLAKARLNPPDLILCDLDMPVMDGIETLAQLRADPLLAHIPLVLITGGATEAEEQRMLRGGASAVLRKPFPFPALLAVVGSQLGISLA